VAVRAGWTVPTSASSAVAATVALVAGCVGAGTLSLGPADKQASAAKETAPRTGVMYRRLDKAQIGKRNKTAGVVMSF
jgi:predicted small lipoprotein YifL